MATNNFRETLWFKLGDDTSNSEAETQPIPMPIEDRYNGDVTAEDSKAFGLHTGTTEYIKVDREPATDNVSMTKLVGEMKPKKQLLMLGAGALAIVTAFAMYLA
jgi:hypothetical protein